MGRAKASVSLKTEAENKAETKRSAITPDWIHKPGILIDVTLTTVLTYTHNILHCVHEQQTDRYIISLL